MQPPARDEDHGHSRIAGADALRDVPARHACHAEVRQDEVEAARHEDPQCLGAARHGQHVVARLAQHLAEDRHDVKLIVHEEDTAAAGAQHGPGVGRPMDAFGRAQRQDNGKRGPAPELTLDAHLAAVTLDDGEGH